MCGKIRHVKGAEPNPLSVEGDLYPIATRIRMSNAAVASNALVVALMWSHPEASQVAVVALNYGSKLAMIDGGMVQQC
jgi:hypothetical protein